MRWVCSMMAVLVVTLWGPNARADDAKDALKALQGKWKLVGGERRGKPIPEGEVPAGTVTFDKDGRVTASVPDYEMEGMVKFDPAKKPKTLAVTHTKGPDKDKKQFGIYKLEKDKLTVCVAPPGKAEEERPASFTTKDSDHVLFVFERVK
jgi:uncharacterized protein (TIGR03067 family)